MFKKNRTHALITIGVIYLLLTSNAIAGGNVGPLFSIVKNDDAVIAVGARGVVVESLSSGIWKQRKSFTNDSLLKVWNRDGKSYAVSNVGEIYDLDGFAKINKFKETDNIAFIIDGIKKNIYSLNSKKQEFLVSLSMNRVNDFIVKKVSSKFVFVKKDIDNDSIYFLENGMNEARKMYSCEACDLRDIAYLNGKIYVFGSIYDFSKDEEVPSIISSHNGKEWNVKAISIKNSRFNKAVLHKDKIIAIGSKGLIISISRNEEMMSHSIANKLELYDLFVDDDQTIIVGGDVEGYGLPIIISSTNMDEWQIDYFHDKTSNYKGYKLKTLTSLPLMNEKASAVGK